MKIKTVLFGLFVVMGSVCGSHLAVALWRRFFDPEPVKSRVFDIRLDLLPGIKFGEAVREVMETARANGCEVSAEFDGVMISARPGEPVLLVLQRYAAALYAVRSAAQAHEEFEKFRAEETARAADDLNRVPEPAAVPASEKI